MLNSSVASSLKSSENKSLMNGDKLLSKTQSMNHFLQLRQCRSLAFGRMLSMRRMKFPLMNFYTVCNNPSSRSIVLLGSAFNSLSSFHRHLLKGGLSPEFPPLIKALGSDHRPSGILFGDELATKIKAYLKRTNFSRK